jgi:hypothetical protein
MGAGVGKFKSVNIEYPEYQVVLSCEGVTDDILLARLYSII